ncbi:MazG nucleotide pyrophosphohydrolase domain-containing protein [Candidatus Poriferisocius sp.]|uniref:nucleoside triphosphate pyrophosphohydrolase family protein n=1 Tax=Candidatus Poriferisocius sp. TaxID=3101276 RepID=UPI003B525E3A
MTHDSLTLAEYQRRSQQTDHFPQLSDNEVDPLLGPLLGLAGEIGTLLAGYKKRLRDGAAYELFKDNVAEELGDILWYTANAAEKVGLSLDEIARSNLAKTADRWPARGGNSPSRRKPSEHFDAGLHWRHQLPRKFAVTIQPIPSDGPEPLIEVIWKGNRVADNLGDNTYDDSGYRYHDAFHLANAAVLGWSPVARRKIFKRKRPKGTMADAVEDGGRAIVIEEAVAAFMFAYARQHNFLADVQHLDYHALKTFQTFTAGLEVAQRHLWEIEQAVLQGFDAWRQLRENNGGVLQGDLAARKLTYMPFGQL